ncbi:MAG: DNA-binding NtrC family response regulator [Arenicella sp.]|jgi:DNA-binding NtrC family response regulator
MTNLNRKYRILFVDDEPRVTSALKAIFRREYDVYIANSGAEALKILASEQVDVLVSDQRMPHMLGNELLAQVSKIHPQTMRILLTGFMDKKAIVDSINQGEVYRFINKPWRNDEMREVVAEAALASEIPVAMISSPETSDSDQGAAANVVARAKPIADQALLMMEKQQDIRHQIRKFCSDQEIMIYYTQNIQQAVAAATSRDSIGVAIIELSENNRNALHTINLLKRARPELITIALTNEFDAHMAVDLINQGQVFKYLAKPLDINGFQRTIEHAFVRHRFLKNNKQASSRFKVETPREKISASIQSFFSKLISAPS